MLAGHNASRIFAGILLALLLTLPTGADAGNGPVYDVDQGIALALKKNRDIAIARARLSAAQGGVTEARAGYLPSLLSSGLYRKREQQEDSRLREDDYNANLRVVQNLYTGGKTTHEMAIARLNRAKQRLELEAVTSRVIMDVRIAFAELLLNRARVQVRQQSLSVLQQELRTQQERLSAGTVGELNVRRAEVAVASEEPELIDARKQVELSHLKLADLFGMDPEEYQEGPSFRVAGELEYRPAKPDLNASLAEAETNRPEILARQADVAIEEHQLQVDRAGLRPQVDMFGGYEVYSERDPAVGEELNHGYVVGVNASWKIFDGFATKGRMQATRARQTAAAQALASARLLVAMEVRNAILDLQQADRVLAAETRNVETAAESLELARANVAAGLGTQLEVLQAASDITRTKATRLSAIYLHNAALARLDRARGRSPSSEFDKKVRAVENRVAEDADLRLLHLARPPARLKGRR